MYKKLMIALLFLIPAISLAEYFPKQTTYQVCFTPGENCSQLIVNLINQAKQSIYMQAYAFNYRDISRALVDAKNRGVEVNVIFDKSAFQAPYNKGLKFLAHHEINIWRDTVPGIAHNKVMIVDQHIVETGSFNYTFSAQKDNAENVLIIDDANLAKSFLDNWFYRQKQSVKY